MWWQVPLLTDQLSDKNIYIYIFFFTLESKRISCGIFVDELALGPGKNSHFKIDFVAFIPD